MTKHTALDRKLFNWIRENRIKLTVHNAIYVLRIHQKDERRHITRRFSQLRARGFLRLVSTDPVETFEAIGIIPVDTSQPDWVKLTSSVQRKPREEVPQRGGSIPATNSEEFLAQGGKIEYLPGPGECPHRGSRRTGYSYTFDE